MKKKLLAMLLAAVTAATTVVGCGLTDVIGNVNIEDDEDDDKKKPDENEEPDKPDDTVDDTDKPQDQDGDDETGDVSEPDYIEIYGDILNRHYNIALNAGNSVSGYGEENISSGFFEAVTYESNPLEAVGYTFIDLNGDGLKELIISNTLSYWNDDIEHGDFIYALYSCTGQKDVMLAEGYARNSYYLGENGIIINCGSAGAAASATGKFKLDASGTKLECIDFYYTDLGPNGEDIVVFHNNNGMWDTNDTYMIDMEPEDYYSYMEEQVAERTTFKVTPFSKYSASAADGYVGSSPIYSVYAECSDEADSADCVGKYVIDEEKYSVWITLYANATVTDLNILKMNNIEVFEDGRISYVSDILYDHGVFKKGEEIKIRVTLPELTPCNAISYYDADGSFHSFGLLMSGRDDSVVMYDLD